MYSGSKGDDEQMDYFKSQNPGPELTPSSTPKRMYNISFLNTDGSYRILLPTGLEKVSRFAFEVFQLLNGCSTVEGIIERTDARFPGRGKEDLRVAAYQAISYFHHKGIVDMNWSPL